MGGVYKHIPYTYTLMIIGTLALTGFPFLSGFYSKDLIIEFAYLKGNAVGYYACGIGIFTAVLTAIYSWRLIFKTFHGEYNNKNQPISSMHESPLVMLAPLVILAIGSVLAGFIFKDLFMGYGSFNNFWEGSIFFIEPLSKEHPPGFVLYSTPVLVTIAIPFSYFIFIKNKSIIDELVNTNKPLYQFLKNKWYFDELYDVLFVKSSKFLGKYLWKKIDGLVIDRFGPDGLSNLFKYFSFKAVKFQSGFIYQYAFVMLIGFSLILTIIIIK